MVTIEIDGEIDSNRNTKRYETHVLSKVTAWVIT